MCGVEVVTLERLEWWLSRTFRIRRSLDSWMSEAVGERLGNVNRVGMEHDKNYESFAF